MNVDITNLKKYEKENLSFKNKLNINTAEINKKNKN